MISKKMVGLVKGSSVIRAMFEEGKKLADKYGAENVYDFSLGNPNVPVPQKVTDSFVEVVKNENPLTLHGYMLNSGFVDVRDAVAKSINKKFGTNFTFNNIIMTVGAAGGLNVALKSILDEGDEVIVFSPYFGEYKNYVSNFNGVIVEVKPNPPTFEPDLEDFKTKITSKTKAVIVNNPNNPTGVIYAEKTIESIASILKEKQKEFGTDIYLISDEPYRELVYDNDEIPYLTKYYDNTIVGYSYSKSLSLPGERIGYLVIPSEASDFENLTAACSVATRILGFVNAPGLQQKVVKECLDCSVEVEVYKKNRDLLYNTLTEYGFECVYPKGAFYLFVKAPNGDDKEFSAQAKKYNILIVPGTTFAGPGYVRIAYCVAYDTIKNSLEKFKLLAKDYNLI